MFNPVSAHWVYLLTYLNHFVEKLTLQVKLHDVEPCECLCFIPAVKTGVDGASA